MDNSLSWNNDLTRDRGQHSAVISYEADLSRWLIILLGAVILALAIMAIYTTFECFRDRDVPPSSLTLLTAGGATRHTIKPGLESQRPESPNQVLVMRQGCPLVLTLVSTPCGRYYRVLEEYYFHSTGGGRCPLHNGGLPSYSTLSPLPGGCAGIPQQPPQLNQQSLDLLPDYEHLEKCGSWQLRL